MRLWKTQFDSKQRALNGQQWVIDRDLTIGRDVECDIVIPDRQVSRRHARISLSGNGVLLEDLGSKNGTFLNNQAVSSPDEIDRSR